MTYKELDFFFPFLVLGYGFLMTIVLHSKFLMKIAEERFPQPLLQQMNSHRVLGWVCLILGSFWSLQNIWFL